MEAIVFGILYLQSYGQERTNVQVQNKTTVVVVLFVVPQFDTKDTKYVRISVRNVWLSILNLVFETNEQQRREQGANLGKHGKLDMKVQRVIEQYKLQMLLLDSCAILWFRRAGFASEDFLRRASVEAQ